MRRERRDEAKKKKNERQPGDPGSEEILSDLRLSPLGIPVKSKSHIRNSLSRRAR